jgi:hypothetical protein
MPTQTSDERIATCDEAIETAIATMKLADNGLDRVGALRLLVSRVVRKNRTNSVRPRSANEVSGAQ